MSVTSVSSTGRIRSSEPSAQNDSQSSVPVLAAGAAADGLACAAAASSPLADDLKLGRTTFLARVGARRSASRGALALPCTAGAAANAWRALHRQHRRRQREADTADHRRQSDAVLRERGADRIGKEGGVDLWISPEALRRLYPDALQSHPNGLSIQVKSSIAGAIEHLRGGMDRGRIIPVVVGVCPPRNCSAREVILRVLQDGVWTPNFSERSEHQDELDEVVMQIIDLDVPLMNATPRWISRQAA